MQRIPHCPLRPSSFQAVNSAEGRTRPPSLVRLASFAGNAALLLFIWATCLAVSPPVFAQGTALSGMVSAMDDRGTTIALDRPAQRVVCLYGALVDMFQAMGRTDLLAARTAADENEALRELPSIGTHMRPSVELVLSLAPDLVLQMGTREAVLEPVARLEDLGIPVAVFQPESLADVSSVLVRIGTLTGTDEEARAVVLDMEQRIGAVRERLAGLSTEDIPTVFFEIRYPNLLAAGTGSLVDEVVTLAGGANCVASRGRMVRLGEEMLLATDPDVYLIQTGPMNPSPVPLEDRPLFAGLAAFRTGRVHVVQERLYSRPGPGLARAVEELAALLHPELFEPGTEARDEAAP